MHFHSQVVIFCTDILRKQVDGLGTAITNSDLRPRDREQILVYNKWRVRTLHWTCTKPATEVKMKMGDQKRIHLSFACCKWKLSSCSAQVLKCSASFSLWSISSSVSLIAFSRSLSRRSCFTCTYRPFRMDSKILQHQIVQTFFACLLQFSAVLFLNLFVSFFKLFFSEMANAFLIQCLKYKYQTFLVNVLQ